VLFINKTDKTFSHSPTNCLKLHEILYYKVCM